MAARKIPGAAAFDPRIGNYILKAPESARPILEYVRQCAHEACPDIVETLKWSSPFYTHTNEKIVVFTVAFKEHCRVGLWNAEAARSLRESVGADRNAVGATVKVRSVKDLPPKKELLASIRKAWDDAGAGLTVMRRRDYQTPKAPLEIPSDLQAALQKNKAAKQFFDRFSPSARREYVEWITGAKQQATRDRRLAKAIEWIADGKQRNWKYQRGSLSGTE